MTILKKFVISLAFLSLVACAQTSVQPLSQNTFKVATVAAPACGAKGARDVAFRTAAIEVIKKGKDKFIVLADQGGPGQTNLTYNPYAGFQTYTDNRQDMVVKLLDPRDTEYSNGLSARQILGPQWQEIVAEGAPNNCNLG
ncbi:hypothetical protein ACOXXX_05745 [Thalassococcus sp. BH17M4-6]|uniref:hypothetical protein n=1 Tax=Thalassococcus sp. BH17M4-6 TaxID=3413148 RepID=UPI003BCA5E27